MTPAELAAWVAETRARQGLEPTISDRKTISKAAALVARVLADHRRDVAPASKPRPPVAREGGRRASP